MLIPKERSARVSRLAGPVLLLEDSCGVLSSASKAPEVRVDCARKGSCRCLGSGHWGALVASLAAPSSSPSTASGDDLASLSPPLGRPLGWPSRGTSDREFAKYSSSISTDEIVEDATESAQEAIVSKGTPLKQKPEIYSNFLPHYFAKKSPQLENFLFFREPHKPPKFFAPPSFKKKKGTSGDLPCCLARFYLNDRGGASFFRASASGFGTVDAWSAAYDLLEAPESRPEIFREGGMFLFGQFLLAGGLPFRSLRVASSCCLVSGCGLWFCVAVDLALALIDLVEKRED